MLQGNQAGSIEDDSHYTRYIKNPTVDGASGHGERIYRKKSSTGGSTGINTPRNRGSQASHSHSSGTGPMYANIDELEYHEVASDSANDRRDVTHVDDIYARTGPGSTAGSHRYSEPSSMGGLTQTNANVDESQVIPQGI